MIAVSSCLAGVACTYKGSHHKIEKIRQLVKENKAIMICPEVLAGMSIPRDPCEIIDRRVLSNQGKDCTKEYQEGALKALAILKKHNVDVVLLKAKSPSCGKGKVYDGTFSHTLVEGDGITVTLLEENGIIVYNEDHMDEFFKYIEKR